MKKIICLLILSVTSSFLYSNGVGVLDAHNGIYLKLLSSSVNVSVEDQVSVTTATQVFKNIIPDKKEVKYVFPLPDGASATGLEWQINGIWHSAVFAAGGQDTTLPGPGTIHPSLLEYMGETPLFFSIPDSIHADSIMIVKITYVQLLKYSFGTVYYDYPNDYHLIQTASILTQQFDFNLISQRTIDSIKITSHIPQSINNTGHTASVSVLINEQPATADYKIEYSLNSNELGLFSMSSFVPDTLLPDSVGRGFFVFIAEPNPNQANILNKVFTLIIDRSGSMYGIKMEQAKQAASFIVNHLNEGDKFNLIDFDDVITSFQPSHVPFNEDYKVSALNYIAALTARGMTDISGAFGVAIPQFINVNDSTANIIIFFTDGQATAGITNTEGILSHVNNLTSQVDSSLTIFTFGIGDDANRQLLTLLAVQHNGLCEFLEDDEVEERISAFYLKIRNPVLINTSVTFTPDVIIQPYPDPLPNLYKGQQLIVSGRYQEPGTVNVNLSGTAFGQPVSYQYPMQLSSTYVERYLFLTKIWAKLKVENMLVLYYSLDPNSPQAVSLKEQIIWLSVNYGISSPFTHFSGGTVGIDETPSDKKGVSAPGDFQIVGNYPNPFNPATTIVFNVSNEINGYAFIRIYNMLGELIKEFRVLINSEGEYRIIWNGNDEQNNPVSSGSYIYVISYNNTVLSGKMTLLK